MQNPDELIDFYRYPTGFSDKKFVETVLKDVANSKKLKKAGEPYKSAQEMLVEYGITMQQLKDIINAETQAKNLEIKGKILSGNVKVDEEGNVVRIYARAGELMVQCIEDAYKDELGFNVPITGEYLWGSSWSDAH